MEPLLQSHCSSSKDQPCWAPDPFLLLKIYALAGLKGQIEIADIFMGPFSAFNFGLYCIAFLTLTNFVLKKTWENVVAWKSFWILQQKKYLWRHYWVATASFQIQYFSVLNGSAQLSTFNNYLQLVTEQTPHVCKDYTRRLPKKGQYIYWKSCRTSQGFAIFHCQRSQGRSHHHDTGTITK